MRRSSSPLAGISAGYLEAMYAAYREAPESVEASWRVAFDLAAEFSSDSSAPDSRDAVGIATAILALRLHGHLAAATNPLAPVSADELPQSPLPALASMSADERRLLLDRLKATHLGRLSVETGHIDDPTVRDWLIARFEEDAPAASAEDRRAVLAQLAAAEAFEALPATKAPTKKRFGIEGGESLIPLVSRIFERAAAGGVTDVVIGSMHRGRMNLMANVLEEPLPWLLARFFGTFPFPGRPGLAADVVYHLGCERVVHTRAGPLTVQLLPNPSHLEAVNAVALGRTRALQDRLSGAAARVLPLILHTDASIIAQGVVAECLQLSGVTGFATGGAVHIVVNNQIGFTTEPSEARTSRYCTGAFKAIDSAILHVNGDDPDAVLRAGDIAVDFRTSLGRDAVIDLVCYRRRGHNELDEPRFTQPVLYRSIDARPGLQETYAQRLIEAGDIDVEGAARIVGEKTARLDAAFRQMEAGEVGAPDVPAGRSEAEPLRGTGVAEVRLLGLLHRLSEAPGGASLNPKIERIMRQSLESAAGGISWATAESLAFATLVTDGVPVRLSGQDSVRGAFSQRHLALFDADTGTRYVPLNNLAEHQARFDAVNSPLSEYAVLAFEYGYSLDSEGLTVWEAQFGDFANGAQIVIDQFIVSGEEKWLQRSGLVVLLPHGLEGQGPEHSSARVERLLQLGAGGNIKIANPSTPANYFHLLRAQALAGDRKPLFVASPKTLLRLRAAVSPLSALAPGECFRPIIVDEPAGLVAKVLLCSGKIAYDLLQERARQSHDSVAIARLELLYPPPLAALRELFLRWPDAELCWVQEEPANMGAWTYLDRELPRALESTPAPGRKVEYVSRPECASPPGSFHSDHAADQEALIRRALSVSTRPSETGGTARIRAAAGG